MNTSARTLVLAVNRTLAENTPIDTGWARTNWIPSVGRPFAGTAGSRDNVTLAGVSAGVAAISVWDMFKDSAFITNNVPYIEDLNAGTSPQASPGFIQASIEAGIASARNRR